MDSRGHEAGTGIWIETEQQGMTLIMLQGGVKDENKIDNLVVLGNSHRIDVWVRRKQTG